jgi:DNA-binding beta-propeller fold protein YncE
VNTTFMVGTNPVRGLVSPDNSLLYVSNFGSDTVAMYAITTGRIVGAANVGSKPEAMALSPSQPYLLVVDTRAGDVAFLKLDAERRVPANLMTVVPVGRQPREIAVKAFTVRQ